MEQYGLELILEIAHFGRVLLLWILSQAVTQSKVSWDQMNFMKAIPTVKRWVENNAYTNMMVVWLFEEVEKLRNQLSPEIFQSVAAKVQLSEDNFSQMTDIRKNLCLEINPEGIIAQFEGYFDLKDLDWDHYREKIWEHLSYGSYFKC